MKLFLAPAALLLAACGGTNPPAIAVEEGWARATIAGQDGGAAYFTVSNRGGGDDLLLEVSVPRAEQAMLHSSSIDHGVMRMRHLPKAVVIPAGTKVEFAPNGTHVMLAGLATPLRAGEQFPATLRFAKAGTVQVTIKVEDPSQR